MTPHAPQLPTALTSLLRGLATARARGGPPMTCATCPWFLLLYSDGECQLSNKIKDESAGCHRTEAYCLRRWAEAVAEAERLQAEEEASP